jgi:hypothetical protein
MYHNGGAWLFEPCPLCFPLICRVYVVEEADAIRIPFVWSCRDWPGVAMGDAALVSRARQVDTASAARAGRLRDHAAGDGSQRHHGACRWRWATQT